MVAQSSRPYSRLSWSNNPFCRFTNQLFFWDMFVKSTLMIARDTFFALVSEMVAFIASFYAWAASFVSSFLFLGPPPCQAFSFGSPSISSTAPPLLPHFLLSHNAL